MSDQCESLELVIEEVRKSMKVVFGQNPTQEQIEVYVQQAYNPIKKIICKYVCESSRFYGQD
jgi:hypothetical protein